MSYHIYQTNAFIIDSSPLGEANKIYTLLTEDLGMISATAQSVRHLKSKLRYSLQDLSFSRISLVKGKEFWRITSAGHKISLFDQRLSIELRRAISGLLNFTKRFSPSEGKDRDIYSLISDTCAFILREKALFDDKKNIILIEVLYQVRLMNILGYIAPDGSMLELVNSNEFSSDIIKTSESLISKLKSELKKAIDASQL